MGNALNKCSKAESLNRQPIFARPPLEYAINCFPGRFLQSHPKRYGSLRSREENYGHPECEESQPVKDVMNYALTIYVVLGSRLSSPQCEHHLHLPCGLFQLSRECPAGSFASQLPDTTQCKHELVDVD